MESQRCGRVLKRFDLEFGRYVRFGQVERQREGFLDRDEYKQQEVEMCLVGLGGVGQ